MGTLEFPVRNRALSGMRIYPRTLICREGFKNIQGIWTPDDDILKYEKNKSAGILPEKYLDPSVVQYAYNSLGYRTKEFDEFKSGEFIMCIGCSYTEGTGLNNSEVWHHLLGEHFNLPVMNLGLGGGSSDTIALNSVQYVKNKLPKPKLVIFQWPGAYRKIFVNERHRGEPYTLQSIVPSINYSSSNLVENLDLKYVQERYIVYKELAYVNQYADYMTANTLFTGMGVPTFNFTLNHDNEFQMNYLFDKLQIENLILPAEGDVARDTLHPGTETQKWFAKTLMPNIGQILNAI